MSQSTDKITAKHWWGFIGICTMAFIGFLDYTIVTIALPNIQHTFSASVTQLQWVLNIYALVLSGLMAVMGKVADTFGHRKVFFIGVVFFAISSLGAGLSPTLDWLIFFRAIQGICGAILFPVAAALILHHFPSTWHDRILAIYSSIIGLSLAAGPLLGGLIISFVSWRWIFFVNLPICLIGLIICCLTVKESVADVIPKIDWLGCLLLFVSISSLILGILNFESSSITDHLTIIYFSITIVGLILLYLTESRVKDPLFNFHLFKNTQFFSGVCITTLGGGLSICIMFFDVLYMRNIQHVSSFLSGLMLSIIPISIILLSPLVSRLGKKFSVSFIISIGMITGIMSSALHLLITVTTTLELLIIPFALLGFTWGTANIMSTKAAQLSVPPQQLAVATGMTFSFWNIGGSICLAIATTLFHIHESKALALHLLKNHITILPQQQAYIKTLIANPDHAKQVMAQLGSQLGHKIYPLFKLSFIQGFRSVMYFLIIFSALILISQLLMKIKNKTTTT